MKKFFHIGSSNKHTNEGHNLNNPAPRKIKTTGGGGTGTSNASGKPLAKPLVKPKAVVSSKGGRTLGDGAPPAAAAAASAKDTSAGGGSAVAEQPHPKTAAAMAAEARLKNQSAKNGELGKKLEKRNKEFKKNSL
ncbi:hypothetical protein PACTADRAFT_50005 [Pachysolen tannophilus NRRL Y-2460]|uniref:Uncharacterized protein n=1 Tax=Pachysolen tannophilus NRRL Y-2460 TaxID=669874 RepID=A0A1E4TU41_PACTA|nr:hypothetical protein PACTADRAFT_50005 [Pachysolen tannophilus NRRL Y-2460]